jgi:hypothetical protein
MPLRTLTAALPLPKEEIVSNKWIHEGTQPNGTPTPRAARAPKPCAAKKTVRGVCS